jgi:hypothetical protein
LQHSGLTTTLPRAPKVIIIIILIIIIINLTVEGKPKGNREVGKIMSILEHNIKASFK